MKSLCVLQASPCSGELLTQVPGTEQTQNSLFARTINVGVITDTLTPGLNYWSFFRGVTQSERFETSLLFPNRAWSWPVSSSMPSSRTTTRWVSSQTMAFYSIYHNILWAVQCEDGQCSCLTTTMSPVQSLCLSACMRLTGYCWLTTGVNVVCLHYWHDVWWTLAGVLNSRSGISWYYLCMYINYVISVRIITSTTRPPLPCYIGIGWYWNQISISTYRILAKS